MTSLEDLESQILIIPYVEMEPHLKRGAVFLLDESLDLLTVGKIIADDDKSRLLPLLAENLVTKASMLEFESWKQHKQFFRILILQPFVLAQSFANLATPLPN